MPLAAPNRHRHRQPIRIGPCATLRRRGSPEAQTDLGLLYAKGFGVEKDYATAMQWFQRAAGQGSPRAQYYIGMI